MRPKLIWAADVRHAECTVLTRQHPTSPVTETTLGHRSNSSVMFCPVNMLGSSTVLPESVRLVVARTG